MVSAKPKTDNASIRDLSPEEKKALIEAYKPHPVDVEDVRLDDDLVALAEFLAKNVHEVWSTDRLAEGWRYGETRDDLRKLHPCLVPYALLTEEEKRLDRLSAMNTLRVLRKLGYTFCRKQSEE